MQDNLTFSLCFEVLLRLHAIGDGANLLICSVSAESGDPERRPEPLGWCFIVDVENVA